jgi:hypothetical protein
VLVNNCLSLSLSQQQWLLTTPIIFTNNQWRRLAINMYFAGILEFGNNQKSYTLQKKTHRKVKNEAINLVIYSDHNEQEKKSRDEQ